MPEGDRCQGTPNCLQARIDMIIDGIRLGSDVEPFIIAELSANHGGNLEIAKQSIIEAAKTGVSAIKLQTYTPATMTIQSDRPDFLINEGLWAGRTLHDLYNEAHTPFEWHKELFDLAKDLGVIMFSTPFDETAVDLLEDLNTPAYKVASFELVDTYLLRYIADTRKPIFLSTGMASKVEISKAVETIRSVSDSPLLLFHCVSNYPALTEEYQLNNLLWLQETFDTLVGLSDHTTTNIAAITSIGMGAAAIEKHFKLSGESGPDAEFSLTIDELGSLVTDCNLAWASKGKPGFTRPTAEKESLVFRRSLYFVRDMSPGQIITASDIRRIRPGYGLPVSELENVIGKIVVRSIRAGEPVTYEKIQV